MKKLLIYLKDYKKETVLGPLFKLLEALFELFVPLVIASIIDTGIAGGDKGYIMKMCLILILLAIIGLVCAITAQFYAAKAAVGFSTKLRSALFKKINSLSFAQIDKLGSASLVTRMTSDINQLQTGVNLVLRLFLRSPFIVFGAMIMAFFVDVRSAFVFVVTIPVLSIVVFSIMLITIPLYKKVQGHLDNVLRSVRENVVGVRVLRAFCKEKDEIKEFEEKTDALTVTQKLVGKVSALMNPLTFVIINIAIIYLIHTGSMQVNSGSLSQGQVVALYNYMSQILVELVKLASLIITVTKSFACANRVQNIFEIDTSVEISNDDSVKDSNVITFKNVSITYPGSSGNALSNVSFELKKGETLGIIGPTGSGKTTLVNLIGRFYEATAGEILIDGRNIRSYPLETLRSKIGIVMQKAVLFKGTIRDNLLWGNKNATEDDLNDAIDNAQARDIINAKAKGLDEPLVQGAKNLSGGQRQRITIARALVKKPEILILDDSASALDYVTDANLRKSIKEMTGNPTVIIVSQRTASIQSADKIIVLDDGDVVGIGTHDELLKNCDVYQEIYQSQF